MESLDHQRWPDAEQRPWQGEAGRRKLRAAASAHIDRGSDLAGNSWLPRAIYSSPAQALAVAQGGEESPLWAMDDDASERALSMLSMQWEMERLGMPSAEQDSMFAAAYVRGLEKAVLADPAYERVVKQVSSSPTAPAWQEIEFARTIAQTHIATAGLSYRSYVTSHGMDPDVLHQTAENEPVSFAQVHQAQALFTSSMPAEMQAGADPTSEKRRSEQRQRRNQARFTRGRINREYNAEADAEFSLTD